MRGRYEMVPWVLVVMGLVGLFLGQPGYTLKIPRSSFCNGRTSGYYADVTTGCQVYHMCDGLGRQFSYSCPNATLFQQRMLICDHWYMVNCSRATADYDANLLIGQKDKHFVEDSESNPYSRTPRPDLLNAPSSPSEYNIIYRIGNSNLSPRDYVGVESDDENSTDQPTYFPPSHWSTEISRQQTTSKPLVDENQNQQAQYQNQQAQYQNQRAQYQNQQAQYQNQQAQSQNFQAQNQNSHGFQRREFQNESGFQNEHIVVNRKPQKEVDNTRNSTQNPKIRGKAIDFSSNKNGNNLLVNFKSNYKATTPVYPQSVEDTTRTPNNIGLLPPISYANENNDAVQDTELTLELQPPQWTKQESDYSAESEHEEALKEPLENFPRETNFGTILKSFPTNSKPIYQIKSSSQRRIVNFPSTFKATTPQYPSSVELTSPEPSVVGIHPPDVANINIPLSTYNNNIKINFESRYKATTPNYPNSVEQTSTNPRDAGILPPVERDEFNFKFVNPPFPNTEAENNNDKNFYQNFESTFKATTPKYPTYVENTSPNPYEVGLLAPKRNVVYKSNFKATTPKYPSFVESTSPNPSDVGLVPPGNTVVNFHSDFKATTPNYPTHVESTSPDPGEAGLLAPQPQNLVGESIRDNAKDFSNNYNLPLKFSQPHALDQGVYEGEDDLQEIPGIRLSNFMKSFNRKQWQTLRLAFKIPEYDFPLDDATRPSYDSVVNSFEPIATRK